MRKKGNNRYSFRFYSGLNLNQDKATKPQTVQIVRQGKATPYWFKFNPLYIIEKCLSDIKRPSEKFSDGIWLCACLERTGNFDDVKAFEHVAFHDVVVAFDHQAAFEAHAYFFYIVFKAFQRGKFASMNNDIVANQTDV